MRFSAKRSAVSDQPRFLSHPQSAAPRSFRRTHRASTELVDRRGRSCRFASAFSGTVSAPTSPLARGAVPVVAPFVRSGIGGPKSGGSRSTPQLTLLDLPASDDPTWPTPGENGRLLEARPSSMMEAARVRKGILRSLRAAIPPVHRTRRRAARQARTGVGGWGDYFSDTTSPLIYRTVGRHNARKFHIFLEN
jgi:hypothetical protein